MAVSRTYAVGEHYERFIQQQIAEGRFKDASEVVKAGLKMLESYCSKLGELDSLVQEGDAALAQGRYCEYEMPEALIFKLLDQE